uniref:Uncharacterized protein n=1 Tax=viral metagenome TaxID=1070528 RepID=A0A6M3LPS6_9ZZZZ
MKLGYLGIDQYGQHYKIDNHPRQELCDQLGKKHADKMYVDNTKTGQTRHCGYIIGGLWIDVYEVHSWNQGR